MEEINRERKKKIEEGEGELYNKKRYGERNLMETDRNRVRKGARL